jgi:hypothetical protein
MKRFGFLLILAAAFICNAPAAIVNVALGASATGSGSLNGAALSTLTDGVFLAENTNWQAGTVWWTGTEPSITIDLGTNYSIMGAIVQADNTDAYLLEYQSSLGGPWSTLWIVPVMLNGGGMATRPATDQSTYQPIVPTDVRAVRFSAAEGDSLFSVSEIQLFMEDSVPEPAAWVLLASGLSGILLARRRRRA